MAEPLIPPDLFSQVVAEFYRSLRTTPSPRPAVSHILDFPVVLDPDMPPDVLELRIRRVTIRLPLAPEDPHA